MEATEQVLRQCEVENKKPTAKDFKKVVDAYLPAKPKKVKAEVVIDVSNETVKSECQLCHGSGEMEILKEFPQSLKDSDAFMEAWAKWTVYRIERKKKMTPSTQSAALKKLEKMGPDEAIVAINESISNGWIGLFKDKSKKNVESMIDQGF